MLAHLQKCGVVAREVAAQEALGLHVVQEVRQAVEPAVAHVLVQRPRQALRGFKRATSGVQRQEAGDFVQAPLLVHLEQRQCPHAAAQCPARGVGASARLAQGDDGRLKRIDGALERGPTDVQALHQTPGGRAVPGSQDMKKLVGNGHETILVSIGRGLQCEAAAERPGHETIPETLRRPTCGHGVRGSCFVGRCLDVATC